MSSKHIIKPILPLDQSRFHSPIVDDLALRLPIINKKGRTAIFRCLQCQETYTAVVKYEYKKQYPYCRTCFDKTKFRYTPLEPTLYKSIILYDTEYILKKRMKTRTAYFECTNCHNTYIHTTEPTHTGLCPDCTNNKPITPKPYKGIRPFENKFIARIMSNYQDIQIGTYQTKIEAAIAYDKYIDKHNLSNKKNFTTKDNP